jgi:hypothetical protein
MTRPKELDELFSREVPESHEQRSEGWFNARLGKITGSKMKEVVKYGRNGFEAGYGRRKYLLENCQELITGDVEEIPDNKYMAWGREQEPHAIAFLEDFLGVRIHETGAIMMPWSDEVCISPDGVGVDLDGRVFCVEVKCRTSANQLGMMADKTPGLPKDYEAQVHAEIEATGADYCVFMGFDPRLPVEAGNALVIIVMRDERWAEAIRKWSLLALKQQDKYLENIKNNSAQVEF